MRLPHPVVVAYERVFLRAWSPYVGAVAVVAVVLGLLAQGLFWGVVGGLRLWGDHMAVGVGLGPLLGLEPPLVSPWHQRLSLMDMSLLLGAGSAALIARQFRLRRPPPLEYLTAAVGGTLMGVGAALAGGCTIGGFFMPVLLGGAAGGSMWLGLVVGAFIGLHTLAWLWAHAHVGTTAPRSAPAHPASWTPVAGYAIAAGVVALAWRGVASLPQAGLTILAGFALGFVLQRSRLCLVRAFREPFLTGDARHTYALILALALGVPAAAVLVQVAGVDVAPALPATFWMGSLVGGAVFGAGMVWAGGCAVGALWRAGEGHLKLWVALLFLAISRALAGAWLRAHGAFASVDGPGWLGVPAYLPDVVGARAAMILTLAALLLWYLLARRNAASRRLALVT